MRHLEQEAIFVLSFVSANMTSLDFLDMYFSPMTKRSWIWPFTDGGGEEMTTSRNQDEKNWKLDLIRRVPDVQGPILFFY
jgi:hypothetical protein